MINMMKIILNWIISSNIFVATCVLLLFKSSEILLGIENSHLNKFVFFATLFTYNFQRIIKEKRRSTKLNNYENWQIRNKNTAYLIIIISLIFMIFNFYYFKPSTQILIIISGTLAILYPFGLREVPFIKIYLITLIWTIATMLLLIVENDLTFSKSIILHLFIRLSFVFAITIPFDIRDQMFDSKKIKSIPIIYGRKKAILIGVVSLFSAIIFGIIQSIYFDMPYPYLIGLITVFILSISLIKKSTEYKNPLFFSFCVESLSAFHYLFLILSTLLL
jgi:4-hydroxybenzoate polyprenyltransferase|tara:strand:+ start:868 stop:1698 length:831 start_codon:yes stop_codon:yes gene_type:complete